MRLIDADELEELFREVIGRIAKRPDINFNMEHMIRASAMVIEMIKDAPTVTTEPHWIPVTERLPEVSGCYLVSVKNDHKRRYSKTAWFEKDTWFARQNVIAWMPLPEAWRG